MKKYSLVFCLSMYLLGGNLFAQKNTKRANLVLWQQYQNDSLKLLWMPISTTSWLQNNQSGYRIERAEVVQKKLQKFVVLEDNIKPLPKEELKGTNEELGQVQMAIYAESIKETEDPSGKKESSFQNMRHLIASMAAYQSYEMAQQMGLAFVDKTVQKNKSYVYRVITNTANKDTALVKTSTFRASEIKQPPLLKADFREKEVILSWQARRYIRDFMMYHIERSADGKNYDRITTKPIIYTEIELEGLFQRDSLGINYKPFLYRLIGLNPFGKWIKSDVPTLGMGKDKTPPEQPYITVSKHVTGSVVSLTWTHKSSPDLAGFWVSRSNTINTQYIKVNKSLLAATATTFVDQIADTKGTNHYVVVAVDTAGNEASSLPAYVVMEDTIPPLEPGNVQVKVDSLGIVSIAWDKNTDDDLKGYYVYFANALEHEFSQITTRLLTQNSYSDTITLKSLTKNVYYKVVAVDEHYNHSKFSEAFALKRPDIIRPIAPLIQKIEAKENKIILSWLPSSSNDVIEYQVFRRKKGEDFTLLKTIKATETKSYLFEDTETEKGTKYEYCLSVTDDSKLRSDKSPGRVMLVLSTTKRAKGPIISASFDKEKKINKINWKFSETENFKIAIYRIEGKSGYQLIGFCNSTMPVFLDRVEGKNKFKYCAKAILKDGRESAWSEEVSVK